MTRYLYGDTGESTLEIDYVEFTKLAVEACVELLMTQWLVMRAREQRNRLAASAEEDVQVIEGMKDHLDRALDAAVGDAKPDSRRTRLRDALARAIVETVRGQVDDVRDACAAEVARLRAAEERDASGLVEALEPLLLAYDLPDAERTLSVGLEKTGAYWAELETVAAWGATASVPLEIPTSHLFAEPAFVQRVVPGLEIRATGEGGLFRRGPGVRAHRLNKLVVHALTVGPSGTVLRLRAGPDGGASGYDVTMQPDGRIETDSISSEEAPVALSDVAGEDLEKLRQLCDALLVAASTLATHRSGVRRVLLDGVPLESHEHPQVFVERLVGAIAPTVREIDTRSKARDELVLRRQIEEGRREETFVSKRLLRDRIERLPPSRRRLFEPLGLNVSTSGDDAAFEDVSLRDLESVDVDDTQKTDIADEGAAP